MCFKLLRNKRTLLEGHNECGSCHQMWYDISSDGSDTFVLIRKEGTEE